MMQELLPDVATWRWLSERHGYHFNGYLLRHASGNLCIDPVEPGETVLAALEREGVARILITNRNHVRAANLVRSRTGAPVAIHPADAAYARAQGATIDGELGIGEQIGPLRVVCVPGKSPGEVAFFWPERRVLVVGDAVIGNPPGALSLLPSRVIDDLATLQASIRTLTTLPVNVLLVGDGEPLLHDAGPRLAELVTSFGK